MDFTDPGVGDKRYLSSLMKFTQCGVRYVIAFRKFALLCFVNCLAHLRCSRADLPRAYELSASAFGLFQLIMTRSWTDSF